MLYSHTSRSKARGIHWQITMVSAAVLSLVACGGGSSGNETAAPPTALELAKDYFATEDAKFATAVPATSAATYQNLDGCYLNNGDSKDALVKAFDADPTQADSNLYRVGQTRSDITVVAERNLTNADGSTRREIDVTAKVTYADGSVAPANPSNPVTLITGSSSGSKMADGTSCATPDSGSTVRAFGNRRLVSVGMRSVNRRNNAFSLATGAARNPAVTYDRYIQIALFDAAKVATYAVVTGPGLRVGGVKMLSPRLLRDDPLLAGKSGNYVNALDGDAFTGCVASDLSFADATVADCVQFGTDGNNTVGRSGRTAANAAAGDTSFSNIGKNSDGSADANFQGSFVAGGTYTFKIYNDDGWKTVNGQASKTPIATYTATLAKLPYTFVEMLGTGGTDLFPVLSSTDFPSDAVARITAKTAFSFTQNWTAGSALPDGATYAPSNVSIYEEGPSTSNTTPSTSAWPKANTSATNYFAKGATSKVVNFGVPSALLASPNSAQTQLTLLNRNDGRIQVRNRYN